MSNSSDVWQAKTSCSVQNNNVTELAERWQLDKCSTSAQASGHHRSHTSAVARPSAGLPLSSEFCATTVQPQRNPSATTAQPHRTERQNQSTNYAHALLVAPTPQKSQLNQQLLLRKITTSCKALRDSRWLTRCSVARASWDARALSVTVGEEEEEEEEEEEGAGLVCPYLSSNTAWSWPSQVKAVRYPGWWWS
jgi:hypothetical protein